MVEEKEVQKRPALGLGPPLELAPSSKLILRRCQSISHRGQVLEIVVEQVALGSCSSCCTRLDENDAVEEIQRLCFLRSGRGRLTADRQNPGGKCTSRRCPQPRVFAPLARGPKTRNAPPGRAYSWSRSCSKYVVQTRRRASVSWP
jgi:hypothetical protein